MDFRCAGALGRYRSNVQFVSMHNKFFCESQRPRAHTICESQNLLWVTNKNKTVPDPHRAMTGPDHAWSGLVNTHPPSRLWLTKKFVTHKFFLCERCWDNLWFTNFRPYYLLTYIIIFATSCLSKFWFAEACSNKSNLISSEFGIHPLSKGKQPQ